MVHEVGSDGASMKGNREISGSSFEEGDRVSDSSSSSSSACSEQCQFQNSMSDSNLNDETTKAANKRLKETPKDSNEKDKLAKTLLSLPPLGLSLGKIPSFLNLKEKLPRKRKTRRAAELNAEAMSEKEKLKASNFCASLLRIGSWQRVTKHEGDLVAKCYYAKRKLVWEILDNGLKSKIEVQWSDISAIRAVIEENKPGVLELELCQRPTFHRESKPQPRKHTMWNPASDFTNGQALLCRRHYLQFPPGMLDKHYEKLIQCESRFSELSQRPFPSQRSPYFHSYNGVSDISFDFGCHGIEIPSNLPIQFPTQYDPAQQVQTYEQNKPSLCFNDSTSPISVMDFSSPLDEVICNQGVENPCLQSWDPQVIAYLLARNQIPAMVSDAEAHVNPAISCQNFDGSMAYNQDLETLYHVERQLSRNMQIELPENMNYGAATDTRQTNYGHEVTTYENLVSVERLNSGHTLPLSWTSAPLPDGWGAPPQVPSRPLGMHPPNDNSMYSSFNHNSSTNDFATFHNSMNRWR